VGTIAALPCLEDLEPAAARSHLATANTWHPMSSADGSGPTRPGSNRRTQPRICRTRGTADLQLADDPTDVAALTTSSASTTPARVIQAQIKPSRPRSGPQEELVEETPPSLP
jgi:hypothetical protein